MTETDTRPPFRQQLQRQWDKGKFLCVGLDPDYSKIPQYLKNKHHDDRYKVLSEFVGSIIDATYDIAGAYKPNMAFYEGFYDGNDENENPALGEEVLEGVTPRIRRKDPEIVVIGDGKRMDISPTNRYYDRIFLRYGFDALTTNPYFGGDSFPDLQFEHRNRGLIVLCRTTNPGAKELQDMPIRPTDAARDKLITKEEMWELLDIQTDGNIQQGLKLLETNVKMYEMVAYIASRRWNQDNQLGLVVGAIDPKAFTPVRRLAGDIPLLIPGIGKQAGDMEGTLKYAPDSNNQGIIINNGSAIIHASDGEDFAEAARNEALRVDRQIREGLGIA
jgi:orotidine-5'-phosphate decarboxylase